MLVEFNKYRDPRDGSVCVMPNTAETVETKHGVFKRLPKDADNKTSIVPVTATSVVSSGGAVRVDDPAPQPSKIIPNK